MCRSYLLHRTWTVFALAQNVTLCKTSLQKCLKLVWKIDVAKGNLRTRKEKYNASARVYTIEILTNNSPLWLWCYIVFLSLKQTSVVQLQTPCLQGENYFPQNVLFHLHWYCYRIHADVPPVSNNPCNLQKPLQLSVVTKDSGFGVIVEGYHLWKDIQLNCLRLNDCHWVQALFLSRFQYVSYKTAYTDSLLRKYT